MIRRIFLNDRGGGGGYVLSIMDMYIMSWVGFSRNTWPVLKVVNNANNLILKKYYFCHKKYQDKRNYLREGTDINNT